MKKFSKVKYFGAVAAALLAVAPIAAPVVSQVASPAIAQAADTTQIDTDAQALVNNTFKSTVNTTFGDVTADNVAGLNQVTQYATYSTAAGTIAKRFVANDDAKWTTAPFDAYRISISLDGNAAGATGNELANILTTKPQKSYTATVKVYKADNADMVIATKTITVNNANYAKASFPALNATVGDAAFPLNNVTDAASALKVTNSDNQSINVWASDFDAKSIGFATGTDKSGVQSTTIGGFISNLNGDAATSSSKFTKNGMLYQVFKVQNDDTTNSSLNQTLQAVAAANQTTFGDTWASIAANGGVVVNGKDAYVVRAIDVTTGDTDVAYQPVFKYNYQSATATTGARVDTYRDGQTVQLNPTDAASLSALPTNNNLTPQETYDKLGAALAKVVNGNLYALENSYLTDQGKPAPKVTIPNDTADAFSKVVAGVITNVYKNGTYNIPVTVTNSRGYTAKVNVPVTIGVQVGGPVARVFPVNTTITKGSQFDRYADVSFQNSDADATLIPNANISVSGNVDTTTPGNYTLTYTVTNPAGKTGTFVRTITVVDGALTESNADGVVYINKADGATIYSDQATTKATDKTLDNTTAWKFHSVVKDVNGKTVAYNLGGKQYVKASEVSTSPVKAQAGVFTVNYPANSTWSIAVYNSDLKVQKLIPAKSTWATFGTKTLKDGKSYYNLGGNQWVRTDYGFWNAK